MIYPRAIKKGDTVAIIAPAGVICPEYVEKAAERIRMAGYNVRVMPHTLGCSQGSYAASENLRLCDFMDAWRDPQVRLILCARGGYGCVHWIDNVNAEALLDDPKWVVGFSDVSAVHALLQSVGIASVHGSMARYISEDACVLDALLDITGSDKPSMNYRVAAGHLRGIPGRVTGTLKGGNLAVLSHLINTPYDIFSGQGDILFIEDISEAIYATERMLWQLHLSGVLKRAAGLIVGTFTDSHPDANYPDTLAMIHDRLLRWGYLSSMPVAFDFPIGHLPENIPLIEGAEVELTCTDSCNTLRTI